MLGGTFDPVHLGHLRSAVELREVLGLDRVHMIPVHVPPHREVPGISAEHRLAMLAAGIGDTPGLLADDREIRRSGHSYSVDTLASLREELGEQARLVMAVGHDAFLGLPSWHRKEALLSLAHIVVIDRPDHEAPLEPALASLIEGREVASVSAMMAAPCGNLLRLRLPSRMAIAATEVRNRLQGGRSVRYLLPEAVEAYIERRGLYRRHGAVAAGAGAGVRDGSE
ncbi:nicotinate-nucleotide adenylyltransferase [Salinicola rhizosphaerae]|uniref:Probable nicotinate-nucleotide adenylyltransferase n=1 Tax=Salinicola rhizosphaerae TaxID=1443141 RepID=A0ABQ3DQT9_9GAMM|nr:nicotinate-nucleotide adenylyltransferase [Salinicola rhizosphaerae]GHB10877.1 putative nicotinate-nucleotide adenylyltransferase [Salinicola rhizosphaerae]